MSTHDHITAACGQLRTAWTWLAHALIPGPTRRVQPLQHDAGRRQADRQAAAERAERHTLITSGRVPTGPSPAPTRVAVIDARVTISGELDALAWRLSSQLRDHADIPNRHRGIPYRPDGATNDTVFRSAVDWVSSNTKHLADPATLNATYRTLTAADAHARAVAGGGADNRRLAAECPACGRRALIWNTDSPNYREWHVTCTNRACRCDGRDCACNLPERVPGMVHLWLEAGWERFAGQLNARETR